MKPFLDDNFLLQTKTAEHLYHNHAAKMPIIDYHSHLIPQLIAENKQFDNITQPWLYGDHYKWRAMRANGIDEKYITGSASDREKFEKWAQTVPFTLRNPLYHWTHLELKGYFGITSLLDSNTAKQIYDKTQSMLNTNEYRVWGLLSKKNVKVVCTTDDPIDTLEYHKIIANTNCPVKVLPTWRPDRVMAVENTAIYNQYIDTLANVANININSYQALFDALEKRIAYFASAGCKLSDHGLSVMYADNYTQSQIDAIFIKIRQGSQLDINEIKKFQTAVIFDLAKLNHKMGFVQQLHLGALRNTNSRLLTKLGPDTGFDSIGDFKHAISLSNLLNNLDLNDQLAKTIIYNLNPADNEIFATMIGNFQDGTVPGKIQWGSGWWFLDQKDGMEKQMNALSSQGLISRFVGMLTDSRSFLSFSRHEYFRRILCNLFGNDVENGLLPNDMPLIGQMIENICYNNANNYFKF